ncbi:hypothetical protein EDD16DRAFT_167553 [Pisolithus croceorrhizus]|nr:hypothetical protein EDD16DRAFT_167553 [Pisolithus croceorrhizus]
MRRSRPQLRVSGASEEINGPQKTKQGSAEEEEGVDVQRLPRGTRRSEDEHHETVPLNNAIEQLKWRCRCQGRRAVRTNNLTQQTNIIGVDKDMMVYIQENSKIFSRPPDSSESKSRDANAQGEFTLSNRWKIGRRLPMRE